MNKPIKEWFRDLPEPVRTKALANFDGKVLEANSLASAIFDGFDWVHTLQGADYWNRQYTRACLHENGPLEDPSVT